MGQQAGKQKELKELAEIFSLPLTAIQAVHKELEERYPSGTLTRSDLGECLQSKKLTKEFIDIIFAQFDSNHDGNVSILEYMYWTMWYSAASVVQRLEFVFDCFDVDKSGYLTRDECEVLLTAVLGTNVPQITEEWFSMLDKQKDDKITRQEFLEIESYPELKNKLNKLISPLM